MDHEARLAHSDAAGFERGLHVLDGLLRISLEDVPLTNQLERALDQILSIPWLPLEKKGGIFLVEDDPEVLVLKAQRNLAPDLLRICARVAFGRCLCGRAALSGRIEYAACLDERHENRYEGIAPHGHYNVPILFGEEVLGVIVLYLSHGHPRSDEEEVILRAVASTLASLLQRTQAEQALRDSEALFRSISTAAHDAIIVLDTEGRVVVWNRAAQQLFGYGAEEALGRDLATLVLPERFHAGHRRGFARFTATGQGRFIGQPVELDARKRDGTEFPVELSVAPLRLAGRWAAVGIVRDITERRRAEAALEESEARFRDFAESAADWFWELDPDLRFSFVAGRYREVLGLSREAILGRTAHELCAQWTEHRAEWENEFGKLKARRVAAGIATTSHFDVTWVRPDGANTALRFSARAFCKGGVLKGYRGVARDVTESTRTLASLRTLSRAVEQSPNLILITDPEGVIEYVNPAFTRISGYRAEEALGKRPSLLKSGQTPDGVYAELWKTIKTGQTWYGELCNKKKDGTLFWNTASIAPISDEAGTITHLLGVQTDITELKRAHEQEQRHHEEMARVTRIISMGEMATTLAHELNQPLTAIVSYAEGAVRRARSASGVAPAPLMETLEEMQWHAKRAADIVSGLRKFLQPEEQRWECLDINDVAEEAALLVAGKAQRHGARLSLDLAAGIPRVRGNTVQLEQVVVNLIMNGLEAMEDTEPAERHIALTTRAKNERELEVAVCDRGAGLSPDVTQRMFDAFYTTKREGLGMGLPICRTIIEAHGGRLWASPNPDHGTTFRFVLPVPVHKHACSD